MKDPRQSTGFTLVEIAIVLVIIGLLLGGIMKGQSMIKSAKIKSVKATFTNTATAIYVYQDLTKNLPGDDPKALSTHKGNGNSLIDNGDDWFEGPHSQTPDTTTESAMVWEHLATQDLVGRSQRLKNLFKSNTIVGVGSKVLDMKGTSVCLDKIPNDVARLIDLTLDDGEANKGDLRGNTDTYEIYEDQVNPEDPLVLITDDLDLCNRI
jgi:prepilin-type N-terminal cleavage/methylation domain-containing protein